MRIDVKKYLFIGQNRSLFFKEMQKGGIIHFIDSKPQTQKIIPAEIQELLSALKILRTQPVIAQKDLEKPFRADDLIKKILHHKNELERLLEEERLLNLEILRVEPFGDYLQEEVKWIEDKTDRKLQFYCAKEDFFTHETLPEEALYISTANSLDYFIAFNATSRQFEKMTEIKPQGSLHDLKHDLKLIHKAIRDSEAHLKQEAQYSDYLHHILIERTNQKHLSEAETCANTVMQDKLFTVEGWVSVDKINALHELIDPLNVFMEEVAIERQDIIPTHLENKGAARIGEDLVQIYDTPSVTDKDPSLWVLFFFALFFSMIIGDAGYGLILLLVGMYTSKKIKKITQSSQRALKLLYILGSFCVIWGLLTTSIFGISFAPDSPLRKVSALTWLVEKKVDYHFTQNDSLAQSWTKRYPSILNIDDPKEILKTAVELSPKTGAASYELLNDFSNDILLELALFIGCLHIILSIGRKLKNHLPGIGWILFIIGCYLYFPKFLDATTIAQYGFGIDRVKGQEHGLLMIQVGIALALVFAIIKDKLFGLLEAMNMLQIFADVMSYLRLYALGLSGALVIATMNELIATTNIAVSIVVLVIGHTVNLVLCIMGGVIHGLRLNFLEWYHYSFDGGGKRFNPLKKIEIE